MYRAVAGLLFSGLCLFGWNPQEDVNVNSRYTVESVYLADGDYTHLSAAASPGSGCRRRPETR